MIFAQGGSTQHCLGKAPVYFFRATFLSLLLSCLFPLLCRVHAGDASDPPEAIRFNTHIRPILSKHCIACHGPDEGHREADLRLDQRQSALAVMEPGEPDDSELLRRILSDDSDERMPPAEHGDALTPDEVDRIRRWIAQGAEYQVHWSLVAPVKPRVTSTKHDPWARTAIDRFVAAELDRQELTPLSDGDAHRLIRRVALDLTGLPPTLKQVERYATLPSEEVYEEIVDHLLASPGYGEHWAAMWMDIARYADTMGYADDRARLIWPWRDWVIDAMNANMPYDQFTVEQIAGDLLPDATVEQRLATAFHRNTLCNTEGGTNDEEFRTIAVKDRISTTMNVWMGLTLRCAECHSHKYDPISHTEYYQFLDFFNQSADVDHADDRPRLEVYPKGRENELLALDEEIAALRQKADASTEVWRRLLPLSVDARDGSQFEILADQSIVPVGSGPDFDEYRFTFELPAGTHRGLRLEVLPDERTGGNVGRSPEGSFVISQIRAELVNDQEDRVKKVARKKPADAINRDPNETAAPGGSESAEPIVTNVDRESTNQESGVAAAIAFSQAVADHSQVNYGIELTIREKPDDKGWAVNHPAEGFRERRQAVLEFEKPLKLDEPARLKLYLLHQSPWAKNNVGRIRLASTDVAKSAEKFKKKELEPTQRKLDELVKSKNGPLRIPVMEERDPGNRRETFVHLRGNFMAHGDQVSAAVPSAFHSLDDDQPVNRLGVAHWLMSNDNPLTARVAVNRYWARLFGIGIVETEEDFGTQGAAPVNQPLLDWLAVDFRENGWDVKRLLKQMVMSSAYRQDNRATEDQLAKDPRNRYLSRGPRFRLSAEVVRDQALAISGLLSDKRYGPPVYPPNPVKSVRNAFAGETVWTTSEGEDRYRRAIYTYLKRSSPHPLFETFDMASRTVCNMRRIRTNTPLQSFMTLNDETFIEAASALAMLMREADGSVEGRLREGTRHALLHPAREDQIATLAGLYHDTKSAYESDFAAAAELTGRSAKATGEERTETLELAALTVVANVIMNLDEFLTR